MNESVPTIQKICNMRFDFSTYSQNFQSHFVFVNSRMLFTLTTKLIVEQNLFDVSTIKQRFKTYIFLYINISVSHQVLMVRSTNKILGDISHFNTNFTSIQFISFSVHVKADLT